MLAPRVDAEYPGGFFDGAGGSGASRPQEVADVLVDLLRLPSPVPHARHRAIRVVGDLPGQVEQPSTVDDHPLVEVARVVFRIELFQQRLSCRRPGEIDDQFHFDEHGGVGQAPYDQPGRCGPGVAEEFGALRPAARVVGIDVGYVDELFDDLVERRPGVGQNGGQPLEGALGLGRHSAGDQVAIRIAAGQARREQNPRRIYAHSGHEAAPFSTGRSARMSWRSMVSSSSLIWGCVT